MGKAQQSARNITSAVQVGGGLVSRAQESMMAARREASAQTHQSLQQGFARAGQVADRDVALEQRQSEVAGQEQMQRERMDLEAAKSGLERTDPRAQRLDAEMDRGSQQTMPAMQELDTSGGAQPTFVPGQALKEQRAAAQDIAENKAVTNRLNAEANYYKAVVKGDQDGITASRKAFEAPIASLDTAFTAGVRGELEEGDWGKIASEFKDYPDPRVQEEIANREFGPRLSKLHRDKIDAKIIDMAAATGMLPDADYIDMSSEAMQEFVQWGAVVKENFRMAGLNNMMQNFGIKDRGTAIKTVNQVAARMLIRQRAEQLRGAGMPSQQSPDLPPAMGGPPQEDQIPFAGQTQQEANMMAPGGGGADEAPLTGPPTDERGRVIGREYEEQRTPDGRPVHTKPPRAPRRPGEPTFPRGY